MVGYIKDVVIYQGKDIIFKAITNPDSLVNISKPMNEEFEDYLGLWNNLFEYEFENMSELAELDKVIYILVLV